MNLTLTSMPVRARTPEPARVRSLAIDLLCRRYSCGGWSPSANTGSHGLTYGNPVASTVSSGRPLLMGRQLQSQFCCPALHQLPAPPPPPNSHPPAAGFCGEARILRGCRRLSDFSVIARSVCILYLISLRPNISQSHQLTPPPSSVPG